MPIISFWSNCDKETGQTISSIAVSTLMGINHNYKILTVSTGFKDKAIEDSFWDQNKSKEVKKMLGIQGMDNTGVESGIESLSRLAESGRLRPGVVANYAKVVFKDNRLDIMPSPKTRIREEYSEIAQNYPSILETANKEYNMVFVDIDKRMPENIQERILEISDIIVVNINQGIRSLDNLIKIKTEDKIFAGKNIMVLIGKYDKFSKYNAKNVMRYLKERRVISTIPYNTLFFEATTEGKVADYFLRYRNISDKTDRNAVFIDGVTNTCNNILEMLQELQMHK